MPSTSRGSITVRTGIAMLLVMLLLTYSHAAENSERKYLMNFDLLVTYPIDSDIVYEVRLQGVHLTLETPFHDEGLGEIDYFLTVSELTDGKGKLTIEFYEFKTRRKESDVISDLVADVEFSFGSPTTFKSMNDQFAVNLAFTISKL